MYPGNGPFRDLPPWQRPGWLYGYGRGYGLGSGWAYAGDPSKCARFPWLPRWWWANPSNQGTVPMPMTSGDAPTSPTPPDERMFLQDQMKYLEQELTAIRKRLDELGPEERA